MTHSVTQACIGLNVFRVPVWRTCNFCTNSLNFSNYFNRCRQTTNPPQIRHCLPPFSQLQPLSSPCRQCDRSYSGVRSLHRGLTMPSGGETTDRRCSLLGLPSVYVVIKAGISRKSYKFPELVEADLEEQFVRGSGAGGQAVNKTANCVMLKHKHTGIVVRCHATRSQAENRKRARQLMVERLDQYWNGKNSYIDQCKRETEQANAKVKSKARKKLELKKAFKEREGLSASGSETTDQ